MRTVIFIAIFFVFAATSASFAKGILLIERDLFTVPDSIGVEVVNGKQVVIHRLKPKETYYGLSKQYGIALSDLIAANNNKALKIGENVRIPTNRAVAASTTNQAVPAQRTQNQGNQAQQPVGQQPAARESAPPAAPRVQLAPGEYTDYKVSKGETLYTVSRRFNVPVESIKLANGLSGDGIQEGQLLQVPKKAIQQVTPPVEVIETIEPAIAASTVMDTTLDSGGNIDFEMPKNRYGIREMNEKGLGVWIDDLNQDGATMLALHKTVPVGTIVKVTNPMTNLSTFVKVVGKFIDTADTQGAVIIISRSVASIIGILDRRFQVEIAYGAPVEEEPK